MERIIYAILIIAIFYVLLYLIKEMAKRQFIFVNFKENTIGIVVGSGGGFIKPLIQSSTRKINQKTFDIVDIKENENIFNSKILDFFGLTGIKFIGIPGMHKTMYYTFRRNSLKQTPDNTTVDAGGGIYFTPHEEKINYALLNWDVYYARVESAEDKRMIPLNIDFIIPARICNIYKALYATQEWLEYVWSKVIPAMRRVARHKYDWIEQADIDEDGTLKTTTNNTNTKEMELFFNKNLVQTKKELYKKGIEIGEITVLRIVATGEQAEEFVRLSTAVVKARQEAKKERIDFGVEVERIEAVYSKIKEKDPNFILRFYETLEKMGEKGNMFVSPENFRNAMLTRIEKNEKNRR